MEEWFGSGVQTIVFFTFILFFPPKGGFEGDLYFYNFLPPKGGPEGAFTFSLF